MQFFPFTVGNLDQKQIEANKLLDSLSSSVTSLQSDQQNKQHDFGKRETWKMNVYLNMFLYWICFKNDYFCTQETQGK